MDELFFRGFLAALRLRGEGFVDTRGNAHHERFRAVAALIDQAHRQSWPGADELPRLFRPTMATGLYGELDDALLQLQQGFGSSPNPSYPGLKLVLSEERAADALLDFSRDARDLFAKLADAFVEARPTSDSHLRELA